MNVVGWMVSVNVKSISIMLILISCISLTTIIPLCSANYTNWGMFEEGTAFHNGTHISMPYADVSINITRRENEVYVSLDSEFRIKTNITQNATLAFMYTSSDVDDIILTSPPATGWFYPYNESNSLHIYCNGSLIEYATLDYDEFDELGFTLEDLIDYPSIYPYVNFALIDVELIANTTLILKTQSGAVFQYRMERFDYFYIVGSARTFEGHTLERVHMHVVEEITFLSHSFYPDESLNITENGIETDAIWNLNLSEFSQDVVHFTAKVWDPNLDWTRSIETSILAIAVILFIYEFGYRRPRKKNP